MANKTLMEELVELRKYKEEIENEKVKDKKLTAKILIAYTVMLLAFALGYIVGNWSGMEYMRILMLKLAGMG